MASPAGYSAWRRFVLQARTEPRKAAVMVVLVTAMVFAWVRLLGRGSRPAPAAASARPAAASAAARVPTQVIGRTGVALRQWMERPIPMTARNLFAVKFDVFPLSGEPQVEDDQQGFWDELKKSQRARADQEKARQRLEADIRDQAARLELTGTFTMNGMRKALVNGTLAGEGDAVGGFRVLRVDAKRIVVERDGVVLEVLLPN